LDFKVISFLFIDADQRSRTASVGELTVMHPAMTEGEAPVKAAIVTMPPLANALISAATVWPPPIQVARHTKFSIGPFYAMVRNTTSKIIAAYSTFEDIMIAL
jgi:hypothetical protein